MHLKGELESLKNNCNIYELQKLIVFKMNDIS